MGSCNSSVQGQLFGQVIVFWRGYRRGIDLARGMILFPRQLVASLAVSLSIIFFFAEHPLAARNSLYHICKPLYSSACLALRVKEAVPQKGPKQMAASARHWAVLSNLIVHIMLRIVLTVVLLNLLAVPVPAMC